MSRDTPYGRFCLVVACLAMGWQVTHPWYLNICRGFICAMFVREWAFTQEAK